MNIHPHTPGLPTPTHAGTPLILRYRQAAIRGADPTLYYAYTNLNNWGGQPVKDLVNGITTKAYSGWRSEIPDIFDPHYSRFVLNEFSDTVVVQAYTSPNRKYLVGFDIDETDDLQGFGAGPDFPTVDTSYSGGISTGYANPNIAWMILATASTQANNTHFRQKYADSTTYSKLATIRWLSARYRNNISALNVAWGSRYTSFGSAGASAWELGCWTKTERVLHGAIRFAG